MVSSSAGSRAREAGLFELPRWRRLGFWLQMAAEGLVARLPESLPQRDFLGERLGGRRCLPSHAGRAREPERCRLRGRRARLRKGG